MCVIRLIIKFIFDFCALAICFILGFIGVALLLGAIINIRDASIMEHTSISKIETLKPGQIVKIKVISDKDSLVKTDLSKLFCSFYIKEKLRVVMDDGSPVLTVMKSNYKPDNLKVIYNNHKYFLDIKDTEPMFFVQLEKNYLYNKLTKLYSESSKQDFNSNDKLIREKIILPSEEIMIFGKIKEIKTFDKEKIPTLLFEKQKYGNFFESPLDSFNILLDTLLNNKFTLFIISTGNEDKVNQKINSYMAYLMLIIGFLFFIIPSLIIYTVIIQNIRLLGTFYKKSCPKA